MPGSDKLKLEEVLAAVGDLLQARQARVGIVVVGGASLNLLGLVSRATGDIDVIATVHPSPDEPNRTLVPPDPLPAPLAEAVETVARDFDLPSDWMNTVIGAQWHQGLPPWLTEELTWRRYGGLDVGLAGCQTLIALKLFAAVDQGPKSVHVQDLVRLEPTKGELGNAAEWVRQQDASPAFSEMVDEVIRHVRRNT